VLVSSAVGWAVLLIATLNFLGFGVSPPAPSWGGDLSAGTQYLATAWWITAAPGIAMSAMIFAANYIGELINDVLLIHRGENVDRERVKKEGVVLLERLAEG